MVSDAWRSRGSIAALIVGFAVVAASLGWGMQRLAVGLERRNDDGVVTVRGTAQRNVKSDRAVWKLSVTNTGATAADALAGVDSGAEIVSAFFAEHGIALRQYFVPDVTVPDEEVLTDAVGAITAWVDEGRTVLIHCAKGRGRSATVLAAYLMKTEGMSFEQVSEFLTAKHL